jgi:hypothetical protein
MLVSGPAVIDGIVMCASHDSFFLFSSCLVTLACHAAVVKRDEPAARDDGGRGQPTGAKNRPRVPYSGNAVAGSLCSA